jgi:hypothetical protein
MTIRGNRISRRTRIKIFDHLKIEKIQWWGTLNDVEFLRRIFDLTDLPSFDSRFEDAEGDIWQHTVNNNDWESDWVFTDSRFDLIGCDDPTFLAFLAETVHPVVRPSIEEAAELVEAFNEMLRPDGYELQSTEKIGKRPIWVAAELTIQGTRALSSMQAAHATFDADYIRRQVSRIEASIESDPPLAIGTAKELVESTLRAILEERGIVAEPTADIAKLLRVASKELKLVPDDVSDAARAADSVRKVLGSLGVIVQGMSEIRNAYGSGHGHAPSRRGLRPRHATLAAGAASTLCVFLWQTHREISNKASTSHG